MKPHFRLATFLALLVCTDFAVSTSLAGKENVATASATPSSNISPAESEAKYGPAAALKFARQYRGDAYTPNVLYCYPDAKGVPLADCENIVPMTASLW